MVTLRGLGGSKGYASGVAVVKRKAVLTVPMRTVTDVKVERDRFLAARQSYDARLIELAAHTAEELGPESSEIFDAYRLILNDDFFFDKIFDRVKRELLNIECVIDEELASIHHVFEGLSNSYMRERAIDIENVCTELIRIMLGIAAETFDEIEAYEDVILVAADLTPAETAKLDKRRIRGFVTERGGTTSHTVILAKALGIPAIVGVEDALSKIATGTALLLDAFKSEVIIDPDGRYREDFFAMLRRERELQKVYDLEVYGPCITRDRFRLDVCINSGDREGVEGFCPENCDGVGLFRTEFLYMESSDYPSEQQQYEVYRNLGERAHGKEVVIRTLDIGGDKRVGYMNLPAEENPFLGYRAIRICLDRRDIFMPQLRAILRAAVHGNIKLMFPMICTLEELIEAKAAVAEASDGLAREGIGHRKDLPIGVMIETPAAVMIADRLAVNCDFFSIGSNDLIQYTTAADRMSQTVQGLYESCNISVLRSIRMVAGDAEEAGIPWSICGEAASEDILVPLWVAMGAGALSVAPAQVGRVKYIVRRCDRAALIPQMDRILNYDTIGEVKAHLCGILAKIDR